MADQTLADPASLVQPPEDGAREVAQARALAERYRLEFVDMGSFRIDQELFRSIPADLMLRYGFVPSRREGRALVIVVSDPTDLPMIDELSVLLGTPLKVLVGAASAIQSILKKSESSQRVLEDATEGFQLQVLKEDEGAEDNLTVERLTSDISPIIRLIDSIALRGPTATLIGVDNSTPSSSIIGRSVGSDTTMTIDLPSRRYGTKP